MAKPQPWNKEFCSCCDAFPVYMLTFCCPVIGTTVTQYLAHREISNLDTCVTLCLSITCCCVGNCINRKRMRNKLSLEGNILCDCLGYLLCCYSCMALQEYQEVNWRILNKMIDKPLN